jgi:hypothetical protein
MSLFISKPKPLYAPMLATFGGGSANGFKASAGGGPDGDIVTDNMICNFDAATYSGSGNWVASNDSNKSATLTNVTYSTDNQGFFTFNSSSDKAVTNVQRSNFNFSYCFWGRLSSTAASGDEHAIDTFENNSAEWTLLGVTGTPSAPKAQFVVDNQATKVTVNGGTTFNRNQWVHIVGTRNTSTGAMILYLNGSQDATGTSITGTILGLEPLAIGSSEVGGGRWDGDIAIVQTYEDVLTASEVLQNYNAQKWRFGL